MQLYACFTIPSPRSCFPHQEKVASLRRHETLLDEERRTLRHSLETQETRAAQLEAARRGQEGDLQRCQQLARERDAQIEAR